MKQITRLILLTLIAILLLSACTVGTPEETKSDAQILAERRDIAEAYMRQEMTVLWRAQEDITYNTDDKSEPIKILAGRVYSGIPYSHGSGSLYSWLSFSTSQDSNGVHNISDITDELMEHYNAKTATARLSNNCADAVAWAWNKISVSSRITGTVQMTAMTGCLKVGEYTTEEISYNDHRTKDICTENGEETMFAAYTQLQKADAVVKYNTTAGHAMMVVEVHVVKNGDTIDPEQSYITVLEQISSNLRKENCYYDETLKENVYICGGVDIKYTFQDLFKQGYLPVTCKELIDPSPLPAESVQDSEETLSKETIFSGTFSSSYRISSVTITITDKNGTIIQQMTGYGTENERSRFRLSRLSSAEEVPSVFGKIDLEALPSGTYRCVHTCQISTGSVFTVRDFEFQI